MFVKLGSVCKITSGGTPSRGNEENYRNGKIAWIKTGDLKTKYIEYASEHITEIGLLNSSAKIFPKGTVLLAMYGATIGACSILKIEAATNQACAALLPNENVNPSYLYYFLKSNKQRFVSLGVGGAQPNISGAILKDFVVPIPPLETQQKIANILDKAQELIDKRKEQIEACDELIKSLFFEMFGDLTLNNKNWGCALLDELCFEIVDCVNRTAPISDSKTNFLMIRTSNIRKGKIHTSGVSYVTEETYNKWTKRLVPRIGDVLLTREAPIGEAGVVETNEKIFLGQRIMHYRPDPRLLYPYYFLHSIYDKSFISQMLNVASGSTVKHLSVIDCKKFEIKIPPIELQHLFEKRCIEIGQHKNILQQSLTELENNFNALMQRAFKGELF